MPIRDRLEREAILCKWVADGQVEMREGKYRVPGCVVWWDDPPSPEGFPSKKLIATLGLGVVSLCPTGIPPVPQWQHAWLLPVNRDDMVREVT